jgi:fumarylpyruvate hydrolase
MIVDDQKSGGFVAGIHSDGLGSNPFILTTWLGGDHRKIVHRSTDKASTLQTAEPAVFKIVAAYRTQTGSFMSVFIIQPPETPSVAIAGSEKRFAVRRIVCVGRNYAAHARELGNDERDPPFFFTKPADAVVDSGTTIPFPPLTENLHHEVELVVAVGKAGSDIARDDALGHIWGYGVGIDLTRRDLQDIAKKAARPWDWAKAFDRSAPCGSLVEAGKSGHPAKGRIWLAVNGEVKQDGDIATMIWPVADIVSICSQSIELRPGDLIFTGTPAGVGPILPGDRLTGGVDGIGDIEITFEQQA